MFTTQSAERPLRLGQGIKVQSTSVKDQYERDVAPIVTELPTAARQVQTVGSIIAKPLLGGLHHQYVRI